MISKAVVFTARNTVAFKDVRCPDPGPQQLVVRLTYSWVSNGTEGSYLRGERVEGDTPWREGEPLPFPVVAGYQKVGVVEWVGAEVDDISVGETVFVSVSKIDGMFEPRAGHVSPSVCDRGAVLKLPAGLDPIAYSGLVLTQVGYNAGIRAPIDAGENAVVVGDGLVGIWTAQTLAHRGANVFLVGRHADRLSRFGRGEVVNGRKEDWVDHIKEHTGAGVRVGVDTVGSLEVMQGLQDVAAQFGHIVSAGFYGENDQLHLQPPRYKELSIDLVSGATKERLEITKEWVAAGFLDTLSLITHRFPVHKAAQAWQLIERKSEPVLGVVFEW